MKNSIRNKFPHSLLLAAGAMLITAGFTAAAAESKPGALLQQAADVRAKMLADVEKKSAEAETLRQKKEYAAADEILQAQLKRLTPRRGQDLGTAVETRRLEMIDEIRSLHREWGNVIMHRARLAASEKRYSDAMLLAAEAAVVEPSLASAVKMFTEKCNRLNKALDFRKETDITLFDTDYKDNKAAIDTYFKEARTFYANGRYEDARTSLEKVFLVDPFNSEAISFLSRVYTQLYTYGNLRREADVAGIVTNDAWGWVEPIFPTGMNSQNVREAESKTLSSDSVYGKMEKIILPQCSFNNYNITKVVSYLNEMAKSGGVSISLTLNANKAKNLNVTMSFLQIPLSDLLRYLCLETGLKMRVDGDGVILGTSDAALQHESFKVGQDLIAGIAESSTGSASGEGGGGGGDKEESTLGKLGEGKNLADDDSTAGSDSSTGNSSTVSPEQLKNYFEARGVSFGEEATIAYDRRSSRIVVYNTVENLRRMGDLIRQLDAIDSPLVMVEVKMVEISENDWQELGFQWRFNMNQDNTTMNSYSSDPSINSGDYSGWAMRQNDNWNPVGGSVDGNPKSIANPAEDARYLIQGLKILPEFGNGLIKGVNMNLDLSISALCRNDRSEMLSAPKLVTTSGTEAKIKMVKKYYYPDSWEAPEIDDNSITAPVPEWTDDPTDIGIIFRVTPTVEDADIISLDLHPEIVSFLGRTDDTTYIETGFVDSENNNQKTNVRHIDYNVWMPIIGRRKADLVAKVQDGETIVIGGMIDNKTVTVRDRWPVLGDIPLLGRLFSGEGETVTKQNLVIFVTARKMNNKGIPVKRGAERGMPDFNR